ncbi:hypothetical protein STEG23_013280, partial [Scotinomys teguina]
MIAEHWLMDVQIKWSSSALLATRLQKQKHNLLTSGESSPEESEASAESDVPHSIQKHIHPPLYGMHFP